jgi:hypothetical protein
LIKINKILINFSYYLLNKRISYFCFNLNHTSYFGIIQKSFKQTAIYGLATVLPRI